MIPSLAQRRYLEPQSSLYNVMRERVAEVFRRSFVDSGWVAAPPILPHALKRASETQARLRVSSLIWGNLICGALQVTYGMYLSTIISGISITPYLRPINPANTHTYCRQSIYEELTTLGPLEVVAPRIFQLPPLSHTWLTRTREHHYRRV